MSALGSVLGVLVGDASGAPLEFKRRITSKDIDDAIFMKGGGVLGVGPGQITDDGELTLCLANSLRDRKVYSLKRAACEYREWYVSCPFDCGNTCALAFEGKNVDTMLRKAAKYNMDSEANGALMRVSPIPAFLGKKETLNVIAQYARYDSLLSHPNLVCQDCNAVYAVALGSLVKSGGDALKAFADVDNYVVTSACSRVKTWFAFERHKYRDVCDVAQENAGHVKHAFCMAMNFLERPCDFERGIRKVLAMEGDTDTNAAICGGVLGSICGYHRIPEFMKMPVLNYTYSDRDEFGYVRPLKYHPNKIHADFGILSRDIGL